MTTQHTYQLLFARGSRPVMSGKDLYIELETTGVPPGGVRWEFSTRYRPSKSSYRDVLLQSILDMCKKHNLSPVEIRHPPSKGGRNFVDVIFARGSDVLKVYDGDIKFDFYGTQPELADRAMPDRRHVALCIQMLPSSTDLSDVVKALRYHPQIHIAGTVIDIFSVHDAVTGKFNGKILVLLELTTQNGVVPLKAGASIPGWFVYNDVAYLVRFPERPAWCFHCRYDESGSFHSMHTCPKNTCSSCKKRGHAAVNCAARKKQVAKKKGGKKGDVSSDEEDVDVVMRGASKDRASMERRFAELGIRGGSEEAEELARDFGVLALSESDIGN